MHNTRCDGSSHLPEIFNLELFAGQGLSLAVEDAVVLAWHLKQQGLNESALRRYHIHAELPSFGTFYACVPH